MTALVLAVWTYTMNVLLFPSAHPHPNDRPTGTWRFEAHEPGVFSARGRVNDPAFGRCDLTISGKLAPADAALLAKRAVRLDGNGGVYRDPQHSSRDIASESGSADAAQRAISAHTTDTRDARAVVVHYLPCPQKTK